MDKMDFDIPEIEIPDFGGIDVDIDLSHFNLVGGYDEETRYIKPRLQAIKQSQIMYENAEQRGTQPYFVRDNRERVKQAIGKANVATSKTADSIKPTFNARVSRSKSTDFQDGYAEVRDLIEQYKNISQWG